MNHPPLVVYLRISRLHRLKGTVAHAGFNRLLLALPSHDVIFEIVHVTSAVATGVQHAQAVDDGDECAEEHKPVRPAVDLLEGGQRVGVVVDGGDVGQRVLGIADGLDGRNGGCSCRGSGGVSRGRNRRSN